MSRIAIVKAVVVLAVVAACGQSGTTNTTHSISGTVSGAVASGVAVTLSGTASSNTTTDASGKYSFTGLANGSYTVTPSLAGYTFTPASQSVTVSNSDMPGQNFVAAVLPALVWDQGNWDQFAWQ